MNLMESAELIRREQIRLSDYLLDIFLALDYLQHYMA